MQRVTAQSATIHPRVLRVTRCLAINLDLARVMRYHSSMNTSTGGNMNRNANRFQRGSGCFKCECCERMTRSTGRGDNEHARLCAQCYDAGGAENHHSDNHDFMVPFVACLECAKKFPAEVAWEIARNKK